MYQRVLLSEPDWTRFPGWADVTEEQWRSAQWQRAHCIKNSRQLRELMGDLLDDSVYADLDADLAFKATMSMLVPPQMINTMMRTVTPNGPGSLTEAFRADPIRRYMLPCSPIASSTGPAIPTRRGTRCTSRRCGSPRA